MASVLDVARPITVNVDSSLITDCSFKVHIFPNKYDDIMDQPWSTLGLHQGADD